MTLEGKTYTPAILAGRCANGYERDHGAVVHFVAYQNHLFNTSWTSLCGKRPGARSAGYSALKAKVTCTKCIKKANLLQRDCSIDEESHEM